LGKGHHPPIGVNSFFQKEGNRENRSDLLPPKVVIMKRKSMET